ncbi:MAG: hypothetical protein ACK4GT_18815 [Pararhodobacter sp.]
MSVLLAAGIVTAVLGFAALFNLAMALGAPWGHLTQGGAHSGVLPRRNRLFAVLSVVLLILAGLAMLSQAAVWPYWPRWSGWATVAMLLVASLVNGITPSRAERNLWMPPVLAAAAAGLYVMLSAP